MPYWFDDYLIVFIAGLLAGVVNTYAGSGSIFTLSALIFIGLPATVANGTNRVGILMQSLVSTYQFRKKKLIEYRNYGKPVVINVLGAFLGALVASNSSQKPFEIALLIFMVLILFITLFKPQQYLKDWESHYKSKKIRYLIYFFIGFYGGFIQLGAGVLFIVLLSIFEDLSLVQINVLKVMMIFVYTLFVVLVFIYYGQVRWGHGLTLMAGQSIAAYFASKYMVNSTNFNLWIHRLVILMLIAVIIKIAISSIN